MKASVFVLVVKHSRFIFLKYYTFIFVSCPNKLLRRLFAFIEKQLEMRTIDLLDLDGLP